MASPAAAGYTLRPEFNVSFREYAGFMQNMGMVGLEILKPIVVKKPSGSYNLISKEEWFKPVKTLVAPGSAFHRSKPAFTQATFSTTHHGHEEPIAWEEAAVWGGEVGDFYALAQDRINGILARELEQSLITLLDNTTTFADSAASAAWTTASTDVLLDTDVAVNAFRLANGAPPNVMVVDYSRYRGLLHNTKILAQLNGFGIKDPSMTPTMMNVEKLAQIFGVDRFVVAGMVVNSANEGQDVNLASAWTSTHVGFFRAPMSNDFREPCTGRTFVYNGDGAGEQVVFDSYDEPQTRSTVLRGRTWYGGEIIDADQGYILTGA